MSKEKIKSHLTLRYGSHPGRPLPEDLVEEALAFVPDRLADRFSVLYIQSPSDWQRVAAEVDEAVQFWNEGLKCEGTLRLLKVIVEACS